MDILQIHKGEEMAAYSSWCFRKSLMLILLFLLTQMYARRTHASQFKQQYCGIELAGEMSLPVRERLQSTLRLISGIELSGEITPLHKVIFGASSSESYCEYLNKRLSGIRILNKLATPWANAQYHFETKEMLVSQKSVLQADQAQLILLIFHEAAHADSPNHVICPARVADPFSTDGKSERSKLGGMKECDQSYRGAHGVSIVVGANMASSCANCPALLKASLLEHAAGLLIYAIPDVAAQSTLATDIGSIVKCSFSGFLRCE